MKKKQKLPKLRGGAWFYKVRGSYLPATWQGWLTYVPFVAFLIWSLCYVLGLDISTGTAVLLLFPGWVAAGVVMTWIASKKS